MDGLDKHRIQNKYEHSNPFREHENKKIKAINELTDLRHSLTWRTESQILGCTASV